MSIQGYAEAIKDGVVEGAGMEESLNIIIQESKRLKNTVDEMIYLIKLDNVEETFSFDYTCIQDILSGAIRSVKALADAKGVRLLTEGDCSYKGNFDGEKLARAFINILGNSIRYAEKEIKISCKAYDSYFEVVIADDGIGFQNGEENKVFERFYKGENGGTGIGLAITKAIVEGHDGRINAFNVQPHGAAFRVMFPNTAKAGSQ
jgi:signal transduction histidine kinase